MRISLKVIIYLMTASVSLLAVTGNKERPDNINCDKSPVIQKACHGGSATINCEYPKTKESNVKHFCREDGNFNCTNLISTYTSNHTIRGRFSLIDDKQQGIYTVIISTLTQDDAGRYRCVMERADSSTACLTKIDLHILTERRKTRESVLQQDGSTSDHPTDASMTSDWIAPVVAVVVCLVLILILVLVLVLCRHNLPCTQGGSLEQRTNTAEHTTEEDHHFDEIQMWNQQASSGEALPSVYATVNLPADQLHYASVNFQMDSVGVSTDRNSLPDTNKISSNSRSQGVTHPSTAEQTLYSTVTKPGEP